MTKLLRLFIFALAAILLLASYLPSAFAGQDSVYVPGEILIKYKGHVKESRIREIQSKWGLHTKKSFKRFGMRHVTLPDSMSVEEAQDVLRYDPDVEYVEPNYRRHPQETIPNDTDFDQLWGLNNTGQRVNGWRGTPDADIDAPEAWDLFQGSSDTIIAVIDTGVDYNHQDLAGTIWMNPGEIPGNGLDDDGNGYIDDVRGWDFYTGDNEPLDNDSHGTHVAGIIAAEMNNNEGISGVSPGTRIMPLRFMNGDGSVSDEIDAINYAIEKGVNIINMSFGSYTFSFSEREAMSDAGQAGVLFVAAAGNKNNDNDGSSSLYPASYNLSNIISVAATDQDDGRWYDSNYGALSVDVGAPGVNIYSTTPGNAYSFKNGTSMATPHVAGLAALLWGFDPSLTHLQVRDVIFATVDPLTSLDGITTTGGRINAYNALTYTLPDPPEEPDNLGATTGSSSSITLTWAYNSEEETGFIIERRETGDALYQEIGSVPPNTETYRDTGLHEGTSYSYRILAYNAGGRSTYSNEAEATTNPEAPRSLVIEETSSRELTLSWTDRSSKEDGFIIERKTEEEPFMEIARLPLNAETYEDQGLKSSTTYEYRVRAYKDDNYSSYSNEESATTLAGGGGGGGSCFITSLISQ
ncbi:MAG: S8 family serine peptidase [Deltaproteobacteria bacterium]|nr:S8 family serine peptidase [Deltaproteobacteria bacterium]MBN2844992.1 S8 family serine peptidase [Deltaproteobacteria bacterium]